MALIEAITATFSYAEEDYANPLDEKQLGFLDLSRFFKALIPQPSGIQPHKPGPSLLEHVDNTGFTPLHLAVLQNQVQACRDLLALQANPNSQTKNGLTPLHIAVFKQNRPLVLMLMKAGADIEKSDIGGFNPFHYAVSLGDESFVKFLLDNGAKQVMSHVGGDYISPIAIATYKGYESIKKLIQSYGGDDKQFQEVFQRKMLAHTWGLGGVSKVRGTTVSLEGAWPTLMCMALEKSLRDFLHMISEEDRILKLFASSQKVSIGDSFHKKYGEIFQEAYRVVKLTLDPNYSNSDQIAKDIIDGKSFMFPSGWAGHMTAVLISKIGEEYFLIKCNRGANKFEEAICFYKIKNCDQRSLSYAISSLQVDNKEFFLKKVDDILDLNRCFMVKQENQKVGNCTWANLKSAVRALIVVELLKKSAQRFPQILLEDKTYLSLEKEFIIKKSKAIYKVWSSHLREQQLKDFFSSTEALEEDSLILYEIWKKAQKKGLKESVEKIFKNHDFQLSKGVAIKNLFLAVESGDVELVKMYLDFGVNINFCNHHAQTPLHLASYYGYEKLVDYLLKRGANPYLKDAQGSTPLHLASYRGHLSIIKKLHASSFETEKNTYQQS